MLWILCYYSGMLVVVSVDRSVLYMLSCLHSDTSCSGYALCYVDEIATVDVISILVPGVVVFSTVVCIAVWYWLSSATCNAMDRSSTSTVSGDMLVVLQVLYIM